jgi:hypothetical protein
LQSSKLAVLQYFFEKFFVSIWVEPATSVG